MISMSSSQTVTDVRHTIGVLQALKRHTSLSHQRTSTKSACELLSNDLLQSPPVYTLKHAQQAPLSVARTTNVLYGSQANPTSILPAMCGRYSAHVT